MDIVPLSDWNLALSDGYTHDRVTLNLFLRQNSICIIYVLKDVPKTISKHYFKTLSSIPCGSVNFYFHFKESLVRQLPIGLQSKLFRGEQITSTPLLLIQILIFFIFFQASVMSHADDDDLDDSDLCQDDSGDHSLVSMTVSLIFLLINSFVHS